MDVLIAYDIDTTDPEGKRRLRSVARACEGYGQRVQYSVFEVQCSQTALSKLTAQLTRIIDPKTDSIRVYRLDADTLAKVTAIGLQRSIPIDDPWVL